jgi:hypothetical protein
MNYSAMNASCCVFRNGASLSGNVIALVGMMSRSTQLTGRVTYVLCSKSRSSTELCYVLTIGKSSRIVCVCLSATSNQALLIGVPAIGLRYDGLDSALLRMRVDLSCVEDCAVVLDIHDDN